MFLLLSVIPFVLLGLFEFLLEALEGVAEVDVAAFLFMVFMTIVSMWLWIANPISDCGCFGDAVHLTNGQTFLKNIISKIIQEMNLQKGKFYVV